MAVSAMSQHNLQQRLDQDFKFAPSERPKRRRPIAAATTPVIAALALTASFILAALIHVSSYARLAQLEYRRQALASEARLIEAGNMQLRFEVERARAQERVVTVAQSLGMGLVEPASQVDYIIMPTAAARAAANGRIAASDAVLRDEALARQIRSIVTADWASAMRTAAVSAPVAHP